MPTYRNYCQQKYVHPLPLISLYITVFRYAQISHWYLQTCMESWSYPLIDCTSHVKYNVLSSQLCNDISMVLFAGLHWTMLCDSSVQCICRYIYTQSHTQACLPVFNLLGPRLLKTKVCTESHILGSQLVYWMGNNVSRYRSTSQIKDCYSDQSFNTVVYRQY